MFYLSVCVPGTLSGGPGRVLSDVLLSDVLLEIFDAYRQLYASDPRSENIWNSRDGWFKLTHVCRNWRRLVHLSPSRLHVYLRFTPRRSSKAPLLKNLPPFPILVDFRQASWTKRQVSLALAALEHHGRVRGIYLGTKGPRFKEPTEVFEALSHPFPELESLEICFSCTTYLTTLPTTFLGSASCLRRLKLRFFKQKSLLPLLSTATGLVELDLTLKVPQNTFPEESLITNLQRMSCLRRLVLGLMALPRTRFSDIPRPPAHTGDIVPLPDLTQLVFNGHHIYLEALVAVLAAPSLQHLDVRLVDDTFPIPHLCRLICDTDNHFGLVRLDFVDFELLFTAETRSKSVHAQPFRISIRGRISLEEIGNRLYGPLGTVEELVIRCIYEHRGVQWRGFFNHTRQVKVLQVSSQMALEVVHSFQQNGQEPAMDILPDLEQINMDMAYWHPPHVAIPGPDVFEPLIAARKKVGRPITLSLIRPFSRCAVGRRRL